MNLHFHWPDLAPLANHIANQQSQKAAVHTKG